MAAFGLAASQYPNPNRQITTPRNNIRQIPRNAFSVERYHDSIKLTSLGKREEAIRRSNKSKKHRYPNRIIIIMNNPDRIKYLSAS